MPTTTDASVANKAAYQRPYKTRSQRREIARRQHDENADHKFLFRAAIVAGVLLLLAVGFAIRSLTDQSSPTAPVESLQ